MASISTNSSGSHHDDPTEQGSNSSNRISSAVLFPLAFVQSRLFWVYSVIWTLYTHLSSEDSRTKDDQRLSKQLASTEPIEHPRVAAIKGGGRSRGHSAPPPSQTSLIQQQQRTRGNTISTESPSTSLSRRFLLGNNDVILRPLPQDERAGTTCPPQWWQKTRFYLDARKQQHSRSPSPPPLLLASTSDPTLPFPRLSTESVNDTSTAETRVTEHTPQQSNPPAKQTGSKRKRLLGLLNHHPSSTKPRFWKKKTATAPAP